MKSKKANVGLIIILLTIIILLLVGLMFVILNGSGDSSNKDVNSNNSNSDVGSDVGGDGTGSNDGHNNEVGFEDITVENIPSSDNDCVTPFILNIDSNSCCLDMDHNGVCDIKEKKDKEKEESEKNAHEGVSIGGSDSYIYESGCGDGVCMEDELSNCCFDCGCQNGYFCTFDNDCEKIPSTSGETEGKVNLSLIYDFDYDFMTKLTRKSLCGDGYCNDEGLQIGPENKSDCCSDCGCFIGNCVNNKCVDQFILNTDIELQPVKEDIFSQKGFTDYLLVTIDDIIPTKNLFDGEICNSVGLFCHDDHYSEFMFLSTAKYGDDEQKVVYPLGRATKTFTDTDYKEPMNSDSIPIFSIDKDYLDNNKIIFQVSLAESDSKTVLPKINFDNSDDALQSIFFDGNENQGAIYKELKKSDDFGLGKHTKFFPYAQMDYSVREIKKPEEMHVSVKLDDFVFDEDSDNGRAEVVVWYRVADDIVADEFGVATDYSSHQQAGGFFLTDYDDIKDFQIPVPVTINKELFSTDDLGPFLYVEVEVVDLDSDCKNLPGSPYPCVDTNKIDVLYTGSLFLSADDDWLLSSPNETISGYFNLGKDSRGFNDVVVSVTRDPLIE